MRRLISYNVFEGDPNEITDDEILVIKDEATGKIKDIQIRGTGGEMKSLLLNPPIKS